jgi:acyl-coenzyme A synthetase/AMP-(fatty) acid ligase
MKLVKAIIFQARTREHAPAIAFPGGVATYGGLVKSVNAAVEALRAFDLPTGSPVMLDIRNPIHHTAMIFALALMGLPSASIGAAFVAEKAGLLPKLFLTDRDDVTMAGVKVIRVDERWFAADPALRPDYEKLLALPGFSSPDDVVRYVYSSGTTGFPKCIALTARTLETRVTNSAMVRSWATFAPATINMMGFSTIAGIIAPLVAHINGFVLCYAGNYSDALQMTHMFQVSALAMAVGQMQAFFAVMGDDTPPPPGLKFVALAGAKVTREMMALVRSRLCSTMVFNYASTEMGVLTSGVASTLDLPAGYSGHVLPWVELEIVDDDRRPVPAGQEGVLRVRTPELAFYVDRDGKPLEMLDDGWFYPGDIAALTEKRELLVTGRSTEVINRGGVIVAPEAIEEVLRLDASVRDVAVVGVVNAEGIEEIWVGVVSDKLIDSAAIIAAARPRLVEKVPDRVIQVSAIPRAESAKVRRGELREILKSRG